MEDIELYAVRNQEGKWFRRKGYGGYGQTWVEGFATARVCTKIGPARATISFFANNYPDYGIPDLVKLEVNNIVVVDEKDRVKKQRQKKDEAKAKREAEYHLYKIEQEQAKLNEANAKLKALKNASKK